MNDWMEDGECRNRDPELWFPELGNAYAAKQAQKICNEECPVRDQCREYAINFPVPLMGVWGGLTRRQMRAERIKRGLKVISESELTRLPHD